MVDVEADFWKEHFVHLLHKNMVRTNAEPLPLSKTEEEFQKFQNYHPELKPEITRSAAYVTWEVFVTPSIKLRLFIQNQIKGTLLQKNANDLIKIADTKFPYNPFPEISEFLKNRDSYTVELERLLESSQKNQRRLKLCGEFIKAQLVKKYGNQNEIIWNLELRTSDYVLTLKKGAQVREILLNPDNFLVEIPNL